MSQPPSERKNIKIESHGETFFQKYKILSHITIGTTSVLIICLTILYIYTHPANVPDQTSPIRIVTPLPVPEKQTIESLIRDEPSFVGASADSIRPKFEVNAVVRDTWKNMAGTPNTIWIGIDAIIQRYQNEVPPAFEHRIMHTNVHTIQTKKKGEEDWSLVESVSFDSSKPGRTTPDLWVFHQSKGQWRIQEFLFQVPPHKKDEVLNTLRQKYEF